LPPIQTEPSDHAANGSRKEERVEDEEDDGSGFDLARYVSLPWVYRIYPWDFGSERHVLIF
jgi:hypothetical protein